MRCEQDTVEANGGRKETILFVSPQLIPYVFCKESNHTVQHILSIHPLPVDGSDASTVALKPFPVVANTPFPSKELLQDISWCNNTDADTLVGCDSLFGAYSILPNAILRLNFVTYLSFNTSTRERTRLIGNDTLYFSTNETGCQLLGRAQPNFENETDGAQAGRSESSANSGVLVVALASIVASSLLRS